MLQRLCCAALTLLTPWLGAQAPAAPPLQIDLLPEYRSGAIDQTASKTYRNFHLHADYEAGPGAEAVLMVGRDHEVQLPLGGDKAQHFELAYEHVEGADATIRTWLNGALIEPAKTVPGAKSQAGGSRYEAPHPEVGWAGDFAWVVEFECRGSGTLVSRCLPGSKKWAADAKALFIRDGRLVYDIGWLGEMTSRRRVNDGKRHTAVLVGTGSEARLYVDGKLETKKRDFTRPPDKGHVLKIGQAAPNFAFDLKEGVVHRVRYYAQALDETAATRPEGLKLKPAFEWQPGGSDAIPEAMDFGAAGIATPIRLRTKGITFRRLQIQPLAVADHRSFLAELNETTLKQGETIYSSLCVTCHGTESTPGSLPTALPFHSGEFKNGSSPLQMFHTLTHGFGLMVPQPQYTAAEKHAVIQYIRETLVKPHNPSQYTRLGPEELAAIPRGMTTLKSTVVKRANKQYTKMDFGPFLFWTYQVDDNNIAYKGLAVRLDAGPGGVSKGKAWMVYDHDTMRVAAAYTGDEFVNWRGIAFDGSHGSHTSIVGDKHLINPVGPGWASPAGEWTDPRLRGRDDKPYGPLPRDWAQYKGLHLHGDKVVLRYTVAGSEVMESPGLIQYGQASIFTRQLELSACPTPRRIRLAPVGALNVLARGAAEIREEGGFIVAHLPPSKAASSVTIYHSRLDPANLAALIPKQAPAALGHLLGGGPAHWAEAVTTKGKTGNEDSAFASDEITTPDGDNNPWQAWMRLGGFDFVPGEDRAVVCTWMGDVWTVEGLTGDLQALTWRRVATGLFQPLGIKLTDRGLFVTCRDQLVRLVDENGDGEMDRFECYNNDHQVTEHFHEFAMGLQTDAAGNFYYAKSARHAKPALVPHHGTLLKISADGETTEILATGFRAANGVCVNPDGSFFVTDQEGHWTPKNRINWVTPGGFYGNMMGYHDITDTSDSAMQQPLVWITNEYDRSPAELLWVDSKSWGPFDGKLINLSYGYGRIYTVPHERVGGILQGGVSRLPMDAFESGVMRGRFHPDSGDLYCCGMFAWAGSQQKPGGFYRVRYTGKPAWQAMELRARKAGMEISFSDPLPDSALEAERYEIKTWDLKRGPNYGSRHDNERPLKVSGVQRIDERTILLKMPSIKPTRGMEISYAFEGPDGKDVSGRIHNTIHQLGP